MEMVIDLCRRGPVSVLTGAGVSTESGIPDYRGPGTRMRARNPIQYREFVKSSAARKRYWARSLLGWPHIASAQPNPAHRALVDLTLAGRLTGLITQNVDGLHHAAGNHDALELHGALREVVCMQCGAIFARAAVQQQLNQANPDVVATLAELAPDGDAELSEGVVADLTLIDCASCGGPLKPHVVFFGENVPRERVERAMRWVAESKVLLVVGSSLAIFSGLRFVHAAAKHGLPVAIVNLSETRGDPHAQVRVQGVASHCLTALRDGLLG
jgi:NAD+-dependent protein deacetylase sirtuin 4